jgi:uncharacterized protein
MIGFIKNQLEKYLFLKPHKEWTKNARTYLAQIERGVNSLWRFGLGCILILVMTGVLVTLLSSPFKALEGTGAIGKFIVLNLSIFTLLAGLVLAVKWLQRRPLISLLTPTRFDLRRVWQGFTPIFVISCMLFLIEYLIYPGRFRLNVNADQWVAFVPFFLLLIPLQAATEELVFRGYLMQSLRTFTHRPWLIVAFSSILFTVVHLGNPEAKLGVLAILQYTLMGTFFAIITLRDGRIELAIGAHAANNIFNAAIQNTDDSVFQTPALFISNTLDPEFGLVSVALGGVLFYAWIFRQKIQPVLI